MSHDERLLGEVCQELWVCRGGQVNISLEINFVTAGWVQVTVERGGLEEYRRQVEGQVRR